MTLKEFEGLKVGDLVAQTKGKNKGQPARVIDIEDITDVDGYRETIVYADYINRELHNDRFNFDVGCNYKSLKKL